MDIFHAFSFYFISLNAMIARNQFMEITSCCCQWKYVPVVTAERRRNKVFVNTNRKKSPFNCESNVVSCVLFEWAKINFLESNPVIHVTIHDL